MGGGSRYLTSLSVQNCPIGPQKHDSKPITIIESQPHHHQAHGFDSANQPQITNSLEHFTFACNLYGPSITHHALDHSGHPMLSLNLHEDPNTQDITL